MMQFWIDGRACSAKQDPKKKNKATISANVDNVDADGNPMRIYTVPWDWLIGGSKEEKGFDNARAGLNDLEAKLFNDAAKQTLIRTYGRIAGTFGDWLSEGLPPERFRDKIRDHQLQYQDVGEDETDVDKWTDITAALHAFAFYAMYHGETISALDFEDRMIGEAQAMAAKYRAAIMVRSVGVYMGDIYEFSDEQYLGHWDLYHKTLSFHRWSYLFPGNVEVAPEKDEYKSVRNGNPFWPGGRAHYQHVKGGVIKIQNANFRLYRDQTGHGGDFLVLSPIKMFYPANPVIIFVPQ
jgi:hypothetical protein